MSETYEIEIYDISRGGAGVGKTASGQIVFVPFTAPGDSVRVEIIESKKNYAQGRLIEVLKQSPSRVKPRCPVFETCGGCEWQHLPYELQWKTKSRGALHALERSRVSASCSIEEFPMQNPWNYRNRIQLRGIGDNIGFRKRGTNQELVPIEKCDIAREEINTSIAAFKVEGKKFEKEYKLEIQVSEEGKIESAWNSSHAALGFRQVNDEQNLALRKWVTENITPGRELLDLYGGSGNLSLNLRSQMKKIECIDVSAPADQSTDTLKFHRWPVEKWLSRQFLKPGEPRSAIIDPPREGMGRDFKAIEAELSRVSVNELILVGCDADSWAKDCLGFQKQGWTLVKIALFDLFPQTHHLESVAKWVK